MEMPLWQVKKEMCEIGRRIWARGYCAGNEGNHSVRYSENRVICTPTGMSKGFMTPEDLCVVDMEGRQVESNVRGRQKTSEVLIHLAIYKARPDIRAVIHSHPPHATAFAIANVPVPEGIHPEAEVFLGKVKTAVYATPSKPDLAQSLLPLIGPDTNSLLMGNHGAVTFDRDLLQAYYKLEILDSYCRVLLLTRQLGPANVLSNQQMQELLQVKQGYGFSDARLACAAQGCVGAENQPFFAQWDVTPVSARCVSNGSEVDRTPQRPGTNMNSDTPQGGMTLPGQDAAAMDQESFERMVSLITDQIMAAVG